MEAILPIGITIRVHLAEPDLSWKDNEHPSTTDILKIGQKGLEGLNITKYFFKHTKIEWAGSAHKEIIYYNNSVIGYFMMRWAVWGRGACDSNLLRIIWILHKILYSYYI